MPEVGQSKATPKPVHDSVIFEALKAYLLLLGCVCAIVESGRTDHESISQVIGRIERHSETFEDKRLPKVKRARLLDMVKKNLILMIQLSFALGNRIKLFDSRFDDLKEYARQADFKISDLETEFKREEAEVKRNEGVTFQDRIFRMFEAEGDIMVRLGELLGTEMENLGVSRETLVK